MDLLAQIDALIDERHLLTHAFYTKWVAGDLPIEAIRDYVRQYYAFESAFPRFLSAIHSRTERRDLRQHLLENLWDEEHGEENHAELWLPYGRKGGEPRGSPPWASCRRPATACRSEAVAAGCSAPGTALPATAVAARPGFLGSLPSAAGSAA